MSLVKRDEAEVRLLPSHSSETALDNIELGSRAESGDDDDDEGSPRYLMREGTGVKRAPSEHDFILELENVGSCSSVCLRSSATHHAPRWSSLQ
jgi:hypothetical protein